MHLYIYNIYGNKGARLRGFIENDYARESSFAFVCVRMRVKNVYVLKRDCQQTVNYLLSFPMRIVKTLHYYCVLN